MKTLVVYYSRTGTTRKIGEKIAEELHADIEELKDTQNRAGILGYLRSGYQASRKKLTTIEPPHYNPADYDLVILGTPVWAGKMSIPLRTYLNQYNQNIKEIAAFCTYNGAGLEKTIEDIALQTSKVPKSTLGIRKKIVDSGDYLTTISKFLTSLEV